MSDVISNCLDKIIDYRGKTPKKLGSEWSTFGYRAISADNVKFDGLYKLDSIRYVNEALYKKWMKVEVKRGDVLLTSEAPAGQALLWDSEEKIVLSQRLFGLRANGKIYNKYLKYYLQSETGQKEIANKTSGSTVFGISAKMFDLIKIHFPNMPRQIRIGDLLYTLDSKIGLNNRINAQLEAMAKTLYDYWFVQFDFPDKNGKPYKSSGGKMVYDKQLKRKIPAGWEVSQIGKYFDSNRGVSYSSSTINGKGIPMINLASFNIDGSYKHSGLKTYSGPYNEKKILKPFDLVMCNTQQTAIDYDNDIIGKAFLIPDIFKGDIVSSHHVNSIKVKKENLKYYLHRLFNTNHFHKYAAGYTNGTNILGLVFIGIQKYTSEIPDDITLGKFAKIMIGIEKQKSVIIKENQQLAELRDWLLPMLMNGQVSIK